MTVARRMARIDLDHIAVAVIGYFQNEDHSSVTLCIDKAP
jgi:hypothetical protein